MHRIARPPVHGWLHNGACRCAPAVRWRSGRRRAPVRSVCASDEEERESHLATLAAVGDGFDPELLRDIERLRLGRRRGTYNLKSTSLRRRHACSASLVAAMLTEKDPVPQLALPEVMLPAMQHDAPPRGGGRIGRSGTGDPNCSLFTHSRSMQPMTRR